MVVERDSDMSYDGDDQPPNWMEIDMEILINHEIGTHAGKVYQHLALNPALTATALRKDVGLTAREIDQALGWLAREAKISAERDCRALRYSVA